MDSRAKRVLKRCKQAQERKRKKILNDYGKYGNLKSWYKPPSDMRAAPLLEPTERQIAYRNASLEFYSSEKWKDLRRRVFQKFGYKCLRCGHPGRKGNPIQVDHIKSRSKHKHLQYDFNNLQPLCKDCNHWKGTMEADFRPKNELPRF